MRALITGILGQDGSYMAELLYKKGYEVFGIVKENTSQERIEKLIKLVPSANIQRLNSFNKLHLEGYITAVDPDYIYNFAGESDVFKPFQDLDKTLDLNSRLPQNILTIIEKFNKNIRFFNASSCLIFGKDNSGLQNEETASNPIHPYGISKLYANHIVEAFRERGIYACSGIFFNHESERRGNNFFSKKIVNAIKEIIKGDRAFIPVGNLTSLRDYGYAPDYMEAVYLMMHNTKPTDYVIGTGKTISMQQFVEKAFAFHGLDYKRYIEVDMNLYRGNDTNVLRADITKITNDLGWKPTHNIDDIIIKMNGVI